jgi:hypothetical protein
MVNLKALEKSLAKIEAVGDDELEFEANGISVVLRPLTSFEENEVERYSRTAFEDEKGKTIDADALPESERTVLNRIWLDRLRQASLAYAVIEIDGQDLRGVEYIETGESDSNGNPISIEKHAAVLSLVERWGRPVLTQMFAAFGELMDRVNLRASQLVKFDPSEVEEEKERLRKRLRDLEGAKNLKEGPTGGVDVSKDINDVEIHRQQVAAKMREQAGGTESTAKTNQTTERLPSIKKGVQRTRDHLRQQESAAAQAAADEMARRKAQREGSRDPTLPEEMAQRDEPPVSRTPRTPLSMRQPQQQEQQQEQQEPEDPNKIPDPHGGDSFFDPADGDAAYIAEMQRQQEMFRRQQEREKQQQEARAAAEAQGKRPIMQGRAKKPGPAGATSDNRSGLRNALNTSNAVYDGGAGQIQRSQPAARPSGKKGDIPIYKMPTTTLERRGQQADPSQIQIDQAGSSRNPRFVGPRGNDE